MTETKTDIESLAWQKRSHPGRFAIALCLVALLQSAALAWMIIDRINLIVSGKEIILDIVPVDPRSLFRGDYVILRYEISRLKPNTLEGDASFKRGEPVFVTLVKPDGSPWRPVSVTNIFPAQIGENQIVIRGKVKSVRSKSLRIQYGIERYFVQEGLGKALERQVRERKLQVVIAIGTDGEAAMKGLLVDGKLQYEESLF